MSFSYSTLDYPGANVTDLTGINNQGQVVGTYASSSSSGSFLYSNGTFTPITYPGFSNVSLTGINASGQIVGTASDSAYHTQGFLDSGGTFTPISFPGATYTDPTGINASGQIVGQYSSASTSGSFEYSNGTYTTLLPPDSTSGSFNTVNSINDAGQIAGTTYEASNGQFAAFTYSNGTYSLFNDPAAPGQTLSAYLNNTGEIAGSIYAGNTNQGYTDSNGTFTSVTYPGASNTQVLGLNDAGQLVGVYQAPNGSGMVTYNGFIATPTAVCFASGTLIRVWRGGAEADVAVEDLAVGDLVVTASGEHRPVRWLGHRSVDCRRHPCPDAVRPIRIRAGAFGDARPARDLRVSPGHSVCVDLMGEVLVPASALVNGATVVQEDVGGVTYWHVELDSHDLLLAENLPAESYLDMGNRAFFAGGSVVKLAAMPDAHSGPALRTHADFCRPFHGEGPVVGFVRERLRERAVARGWRLGVPEPWAEAHLVVDGVRVEPEVRGLSARFPLPRGARDVWLVSETTVPHDIGLSADGRRLGLSLAGLHLDDGWCEPRRVAVDDPLLCVGFHGVEGEAGAVWRWTAGRARLPAALWAGWDGPVAVRLDLAGSALPRWIAPEAGVGAAAEPRPLLDRPAA